MSKTLFDKIWDGHRVATLDERHDLVYVDRIFLHERTGGIALRHLAEQRRRVRFPEQAFCTIDHIVDTTPGRRDGARMPEGEVFIQATREAARQAKIHFFDIRDARQGIVHVVSPEQGIALPGCIVVCPDSHTCTLGGLGALGWGIGTSEAQHALATQTLRMRRPGNMRVECHGKLAPWVSAKDLALHLINRHGSSGASGYAMELCGEAVRALSVEARLTLCNMAVEFSAFSALIEPDEKVFEYLRGRSFAPRGKDWEAALADWQQLHSDADASFEKQLRVDAAAIRPTVSWGTSPQHTVSIDGVVPDPGDAGDALSRRSQERALEYMGLRAGQALCDIPINAAFIGSCTNSRLSDLRSAAAVLRGGKVAPGVRALCVPGSTPVKKAAEAEGLDKIFRASGFEWHESGCSMCFYAGGEGFSAGQRVISSTNRNFEGRQGPGVRTHLASPATVAASALAGYIRSPEQAA